MAIFRDSVPVRPSPAPTICNPMRISSVRTVGAGAGEHPSSPPARRDDGSSRIVLEQPAGEVATSPGSRAGDANGASGSLVVLEGPAQQHRHAVVGEELASHGPLIGADRQLRT